MKVKVSQGSYWINSDAQRDARKHFGWGRLDIEDAFHKLKAKHFYKTMPSKIKPHIMLDVYHARGLKGEDVYIHFYMERGRVIINSLHELT